MNRALFPGLADGWARLDGPAGTQMAEPVIEAMADWMRSGRAANHGGVFAAARETDRLVSRARAACGELFGSDPDGVVIGPNMTTLTLAFAAAVGRTLAPGEEIVCTRLDHDANVRPWVIAAQRAGATVRFAEPSDRTTLELPAADVLSCLGERTRWLAVTAASNASGTIPALEEIVAGARERGVRVYVDAVHAAPHRRLDRLALGADVIACSSYKWFGPHLGLLVADPALLAELSPDKLAPSPDTVPDRYETGTASFESIAGLLAAAEYLLALDWEAVAAHEAALLETTLAGLDALPGVTVYGRARRRTPTLMFTVDGFTSVQVAERLAAQRIAVWHGNYYAHELFEWLDLQAAGAVRAGFVHYNDAADAERLLAALSDLRHTSA